VKNLFLQQASCVSLPSDRSNHGEVSGTKSPQTCVLICRKTRSSTKKQPFDYQSRTAFSGAETTCTPNKDIFSHSGSKACYDDLFTSQKKQSSE